MTNKDRLSKLVQSTALNGIDFVEVVDGSDQRELRVHFHNTVQLKASITAVEINGGDTIPTVEVADIVPADWSEDAEGRPLLALHAERAGDFSMYTLTVSSALLDEFYSHSVFTFKANCESDLDCAPPAASCPTDPVDSPPIDYLAKDFYSFRKALLDFSAQRYPGWQERSEADFGVMFAEALSAVADDLSYYQDRVAAESSLETATERRSLVRLARLVDYEPRPATSASTLVQFTLPVNASGPIPAGLVVFALGPDGDEIEFETGTGLGDLDSYPADPKWNPGSLKVYWWDDSQACLRAGSTDLWLQGHGLQFTSGLGLVIETVRPGSGDPPLREVVHLTPTHPDLADFAVEYFDPLFLDGTGNPTPVTRIRWSGSESLKHDHDLTGGLTTVGGNLAPATQGRRRTETFAVEKAPDAMPEIAVAPMRTGPRSHGSTPAVVSRFTPRDAPLAWLGSPTDPAADPLPEVAMVQLPTPPDYQPQAWTWRRSLLDSEPFESSFTIDPAAYRVIARSANLSPILDYDGDTGDSIRFGDGTFGERPDKGAAFQLTYRVTVGSAGNVAADAISRVQDRPGLSGLGVRNVFAATGGADPELAEVVRRQAPQKFRASQLRAVLPQDYADAARTLPWVAAAGANFRWTGSWLTVFTTADPKGAELQQPPQRLGLIKTLNRYRMAGYEVYAPQPRFVSLDLTIEVCAAGDAFRGDVEAGIIAALGTGVSEDGVRAFFAPDQFSFGTPLERSRIEAAIQNVPGVAGVLSIQYRQRGVMVLPLDLPDVLAVAPDQILRVDNDRDHPDRGSFSVTVEGGR